MAIRIVKQKSATETVASQVRPSSADTAVPRTPPPRPEPPAQKRRSLTVTRADALERLFNVLANATRLRLLHNMMLRPGISVNELAKAIGMKPAAVSNQLRRLSDIGIVTRARDGTTARYHIVDALVAELLERAIRKAEGS